METPKGQRDISGLSPIPLYRLLADVAFGSVVGALQGHGFWPKTNKG